MSANQPSIQTTLLNLQIATQLSSQAAAAASQPTSRANNHLASKSTRLLVSEAAQPNHELALSLAHPPSSTRARYPSQSASQPARGPASQPINHLASGLGGSPRDSLRRGLASELSASKQHNRQACSQAGRPSDHIPPSKHIVSPFEAYCSTPGAYAKHMVKHTATPCKCPHVVK